MIQRGVDAAGAYDVFERHVNDGRGDQGFNQRREPQSIGCQIVGRCDQCDGMRHGERGHDRNQRAEFAERDHQAEQEQQVIRAIQDVAKA